MQMSGLDFGEIKVTSEHTANGVWYGNATEIPNLAVNGRAETATRVGMLFAGKKAVDIVQRGYSFANPARDEPDLDLSHFASEREIHGVLLRPQGIHTFQRHLSHGIGLFSEEDEKPFGLVVPGMGTLIHNGRLGDFKRVADEAHLGDFVENPVSHIIASKAIGLCDEYSKLTADTRELILH